MYEERPFQQAILQGILVFAAFVSRRNQLICL